MILFMKRILFFLVLISTAALVGCDGQQITIDLSKAVADTNAPPTNLPAKIARAKNENKLLLLEFGSSDSCPPCIVLEQKVFSTPEFMTYEKSNLVFVRLDYPLKSELRPDTKATNTLLVQQFEAFAFPTFVALDKDGKEFWRQEGTTAQQFDPKEFISLLESVKAKQK
jgi:thioredoxin-related protein